MERDYKIVRGYSCEGLEELITALRKEGWKCVGGVCVSHMNIYYQAMQKD